VAAHASLERRHRVAGSLVISNGAPCYTPQPLVHNCCSVFLSSQMEHHVTHHNHWFTTAAVCFCHLKWSSMLHTTTTGSQLLQCVFVISNGAPCYTPQPLVRNCCSQCSDSSESIVCFCRIFKCNQASNHDLTQTQRVHSHCEWWAGEWVGG
jgi:hypothetical protein